MFPLCSLHTVAARLLRCGELADHCSAKVNDAARGKSSSRRWRQSRSTAPIRCYGDVNMKLAAALIERRCGSKLAPETIKTRGRASLPSALSSPFVATDGMGGGVSCEDFLFGGGLRYRVTSFFYLLVSMSLLISFSCVYFFPRLECFGQTFASS